MDSYKLQIMASDHMVFDGDAKSLSLHTTEGSIGVWAHHMNMIMAVVPGELIYEPVTGDRELVIVSDGLLKVENGEVMVLVDTAEKPHEIDEARARRAHEEAKEKLKSANTNRDVSLVTAELSRAISRVRGSKKKHRLP